ncbi:MAG TPA: TolC family protein [Longimicrobiales bacterium]|nr:TolC family protein [Longimicrobiales bacterium]
MRRGMISSLVTLTVLGTAVSAQAQEVTSMTLDEVVQRALLTSPQIAQAAGNVQTSATAERTSMGQFLPNLNVSSGATLASTNRFDPNLGTTISGSSDSYSAGISTSLDLFTGGRRGADLARSRAQTSAAEAALIEQRYAVTRNAKAGYYDVLRATDVIRSAEARLARAEQVLEAAERRSQVGSGTRSDLLRSQLEVNNARQALLQAQNQKRNAMFNLGRVVGVDGPVDAAHEQPLEPAELPLTREELLELVMAASPAVVTAQASEVAASASVRSARSQYLPNLSSSGSYNWANDEPSFNDVRGSWSMRLSMSFPVFNRFQREETIERAQVQASLARIQLDDARRFARVNLERVLGALETAAQQIALAEQALEVAMEDSRVQEERYRLGVSTILEQVTSQENIVAAEAALIAARYDYQLARAELEALIGRDL